MLEFKLTTEKEQTVELRPGKAHVIRAHLVVNNKTGGSISVDLTQDEVYELIEALKVLS